MAEESSQTTSAGCILFPDSDPLGRISYMGELLEGGIPDGVGIVIYNDGSVYTGDVKLGLRCGSGRMQWKDGRTYTGDWVCDWPHGCGMLITESPPSSVPPAPSLRPSSAPSSCHMQSLSLSLASTAATTTSLMQSISVSALSTPPIASGSQTPTTPSPLPSITIHESAARRASAAVTDLSNRRVSTAPTDPQNARRRASSMRRPSTASTTIVTPSAFSAFADASMASPSRPMTPRSALAAVIASSPLMIYEGQWHLGVRKGIGMLSWPRSKGGLYRGGFSNDMMDGHGLHLLPNGDFYVGQWDKNKHVGFGCHYWQKSKSWFEGFTDLSPSGSSRPTKHGVYVWEVSEFTHQSQYDYFSYINFSLSFSDYPASYGIISWQHSFRNQRKMSRLIIIPLFGYYKRTI
eukprot:TRINITY_DN4516_c0_g1_i4.p1 TRINITY_DN4516_c0_g1~~TRINITY_DN4516_c0_g1_i4.p1  ORF type:complete len:406 (-),score=72.54 TRINITY_DN4516_c0_g1_i4:1319-2536(-)